MFRWLILCFSEHTDRVGWEGLKIKILNHTLFCGLFFLSLFQFVQEWLDGGPLHPSKERKT